MTIHHSVASQRSYPYCIAPPGRMEEVMGKYGIFRSPPDRIGDALTLGEQLIEGSLARAEVVLTIDAITQMTIWITGDPLAGLYLVVPVTEQGRAAIEDGSFNPGDPALRHIAPANTPVFGVYCGVYAGATRDARRAVLQAAGDLRMNVFGAVPVYARGATEDGARSMRTLGYRPFEGGLPDLFVSDPLGEQQ